jgi:hypothetical protein
MKGKVFDLFYEIDMLLKEKEHHALELPIKGIRFL